MNRRLTIILIFCLCCTSTFANARVKPQNPALEDVIKTYESPTFKTGVTLYSLDKHKFLFEHNARTALNPASTMKIVTAAAALKYLGAQFRYKTTVTADRRSGDTVANLTIKGFGDPSLTAQRLDGLAAKIAASGIKKVTGKILVDESYFLPDPPLDRGLRSHMLANAAFIANPSFQNAAEPVFPEMAPVLASRQRPSGKVALRGRRGVKSRQRTAKTSNGFARHADPVLATAQTLVLDLKARGVTVASNVGVGSQDGNALIAQDLSPPLTDILTQMNKRSSNFIAEMVLKTLAAERVSSPATQEKGALLLSSFLGYAGVPEAEYHVTCGSGLSRDTRLSARALTTTLAMVYDDEWLRDDFLTTLPIAGVDGTLRRRFTSRDLIGNVRAKTGTLSNTRALAGYLKTKTGSTLAFSIIINGTGLGKAYEMQEKLLQEVYEGY